MKTTDDYLSRRREPYLDEASFNWNTRFLLDESIPGYISTRDDPNTDDSGRGSMRWQIARDRMSYVLLLYSGGASLEDVRSALSPLLEAMDEHIDGECPVLASVDISVQTYYVEALWLLSLTKLLGLGDKQIERVANLYAADETNDGADELFESILAKLGRKSFDAEGLIHEDPYQLLLDCIKAEPEQRPALMTQFLKRWFKGQKECDWWGSHIPRKGTTVLDTGFFGYWAFEAALVTYLWDIDDSSYRDLQHYPKDLIDFARANAQRNANGKGPSRVPGGQPCPRTGYWFTPARENSRARFETGQTMPDVGGTWGATIWQWDEQQ